MKSVPSLLFFKPMKKEPKIFPFGPIAEMIVVPKRPYLPGEKCYMREAWTVEGWMGDTVFVNIDDKRFNRPAPDEFMQQLKEEERLWFGKGMKDKNPYRLRPSVTMPQWAARRFVTIVSCEPVRIEEVTEEDCVKMGVDSSKYGKTYRFAFLFDWEKRHPGKEWAWRVEGEEERDA